jgi:hypothetical protein
MKAEAYMIAIVLLSSIVTSMSVGSNMVYSSSDDDGDNNSENQRCYHAGFESGRSGSYNQTQLSVCGNTGTHNAHAYYQGFIQGCISSGGGDYFACDEKTPGPPGDQGD